MTDIVDDIVVRLRAEVANKAVIDELVAKLKQAQAEAASLSASLRSAFSGKVDLTAARDRLKLSQVTAEAYRREAQALAKLNVEAARRPAIRPPVSPPPPTPWNAFLSRLGHG